MKNYVILLVLALLISQLPNQSIAQSPWDNIIESILGRFTDWTLDRQTKLKMDKIESSVIQKLKGTNDGAAIFIDMYKGASIGQRELGAVTWETGKCFISAFKKLRDTDAIRSTPSYMKFDKKNSYVLWVKERGGKLVVYKKVKWPWWEGIAQENRSDCPEELIVYGLTLRGKDISTRKISGERATYHEMALRLYVGDRLIKEWIAWSRWCGGHSHYMTVYYKDLKDMPYMINGFDVLGLTDMVERELDYEFVDPDDPNKTPCNE